MFRAHRKKMGWLVAAGLILGGALSPEAIAQKPVPGGTLTIGEIPFTSNAKRVLELSVDEARQLGHNYVGTEHLLLGLIREGEGVWDQPPTLE